MPGRFDHVAHVPRPVPALLSDDADCTSERQRLAAADTQRRAERAARYQRAFDAVAASHAGRPLDECVCALGHAWVAVEGTPLREPALTNLARRVRLRLRTVLR